MKTLFFGLLCLSAQVALAQPEGAVAVAGDVSILEQGALLQITNSDRAIIEWQSFSIGQGETAQFIQPSIDASVLNRVVGGDLSNLQGALLSNGHVYLVNPQGIVIGKDATFDTASFLAATLDLENQTFLNGEELFFNGDSTASMINLGTVSAHGGDVVLIAHRIENEGSLKAEEGRVSLVAGHEILLKPGDCPLLTIRPDLRAGGIDNSGSLKALEASLEADSLEQFAIRQSGPIHLVQSGGKILLSSSGGIVHIEPTAALQAPEGMISIASEKGVIQIAGSLETASASHAGGCIDIQGNSIHVYEGAFVDASGAEQGGAIFLGSRESTANVIVDPNALFSVDSRQQGNAGTALLLARDMMTFHGLVSGEAKTGNGAFVEVSGDHLMVSGHAHLLSMNGKPGTLLLDPGSVTIQNGANVAPPGTMDTFNDGYINAQLGSGNLSISTANSTNGGAETVTFNSNVVISWAAATTLTVTAGQSMVVTGGCSITSTNAGANFDALTLSNSANTAGNYVGIDLGDSVNGGISFTSTSGNIQITGVGGTTGNTNIGIRTFTGGGVSTTGSGSITMTGTGGSSGTGSDGIYYFRNAFSTIDGNITFIGNPSAPSVSGSSKGVNMSVTGATSIASNGAGAISITGTGGNSSTNGGNTGVYGLNTGGVFITISSARGALSITGTGNGANQDAAGNQGIFLSGVVIFVTATGSITLTGTGSTTASPGSTTNLQGIYMGDVANSRAVQISAAGGTINMTGTAGGGNNDGIYMEEVNSLIYQTGAGNINITGTATGTGYGFNFQANVSDGIQLQGASGTLTISADTMNVLGNIAATTAGTIVVQPITTSTSIGIGDNASGTLAISDLSLGAFTGSANFTAITFGRSNGSHAIIFNTSAPWAPPFDLLPASVTFRGDSLTISSAITVSTTITGNIGQVGSGTLNLNALISNGTVNINGGSNNDSFAYSNAAQTATFNGGGGTNTLTARNATNTWNVTSSNGGTLESITFSNMQNLTGGTGNDTFVFSNGIGVSGQVNGGSGTNTLDYNAFTTAATITYTTSTSGTASNLGNGFLNIQSIVGNFTLGTSPAPAASTSVINSAIQSVDASTSESLSVSSNSTPSQQVKYLSGSSTCGQ